MGIRSTKYVICNVLWKQQDICVRSLSFVFSPCAIIQKKQNYNIIYSAELSSHVFTVWLRLTKRLAVLETVAQFPYVYWCAWIFCISLIILMPHKTSARYISWESFLTVCWNGSQFRTRQSRLLKPKTTIRKVYEQNFFNVTGYKFRMASVPVLNKT